MDNQHPLPPNDNDNTPHHHLTEPILDASYLDDELGLMLTNDLMMEHLTLTTSNNNNSNNQQVEGLTNLSSITGSILDQLDFGDDGELLFGDEEEEGCSSSRSINSGGGGTTTNPSTTPTTTTTTTTTSTDSSPPHPPHNNPLLLPSLTTFSTDSLDKSLFSLKKPNYTIAFQQQFANSLIQSCAQESKTPPTDKTTLNFHLPDLTFLKQDKKLDNKQRFHQENTLPNPNRHHILAKYDNKHLQNHTPSNIQDWESLKILLPTNYEALLTKPDHLREKETEEKEKDESGTRDNKVKLRNRRLSLGCGKEKTRFKRFSLQEIEEVGVVCKGIEETLRILEGSQQEFCNNKKEGNKKRDRKVDKGSRDSNRADDPPPHSTLLSSFTTSLKSLTHKLPRSKVYSNSSHAKSLQNTFYPALYSIFSDGLAPWIETLFGRVPNGVWRVVEASVAGAPTTQILSELVLRINSESELMGDDGPLKFNAFVGGLLNLGTLPSYLDLLRTKDRLLRTHYNPSGYLYTINTTGRQSFDSIIAQTKALNRIRYDLDIFYETKLLHCRINSTTQTTNKMKRSFSDERCGKEDKEKLPKSKTQGNIDKIGKFKKLQLEWEMRASVLQNNKSLTSPVGVGNSRIPRLIVGGSGSSRPGSAAVGSNLTNLKSPVRPGSGIWRKC